MEVKLYQYPRGANKGGILQGDICPTISTSSWENNCLLIECNKMKKNSQQSEQDPKIIEPESVLCIPQATKQGYVEVSPGGVFDFAYPDSTTRRGRVQEGGQISPTLCTTTEISLYEGVKNQEFRIRILTPRECFRLMGVSEEDIDTIQAAGISNSQQYKLAGNSIVVDVLYHIFRKLFIDKESEELQMTLF